MLFTTSQQAQSLSTGWNRFLSHTYPDEAALAPASFT